ncbi:DNA-processing protein DprA [Stappia stellulata]|uniref:DNA-processing protein DprA n=1 Tax=Stappia stellulata TaxID=71235 RepID=UPI00041638A7|nr:DNA-processing protein DprA [Stappia stellulata]
MSADRSEPARTRVLTDRQRLAWLRLIRSENVGPVTFRALINHAGSAEAALEALPDLSRRGGKRTIRVFSQADAEDEVEALERLGGRLRALGEYGYPPLLRYVDGAPPLISVRGSDDRLAEEATIAMVGARNASLAGLKLAGEIASGLGEAGYTVVSGLARGIDAAAHRAALASGTIAVMAGGVDVIYPGENRDLHRSILDKGGAVVSEMALGWKPRSRDFPRRNRLISGVSLATVLIEAARASGSLHTARFAAEQNREVLAVPGSPLDPRSEGGNRLIRDGATLITSAQDILDSLGPRRPFPEPPSIEVEEPGRENKTLPLQVADTDRGKVLSALGGAPVEIDELIRHMQLKARVVHVILLELELAGRLERHPGQKVSLIDGR